MKTSPIPKLRLGIRSGKLRFLKAQGDMDCY
jgi:hypothetical protein